MASSLCSQNYGKDEEKATETSPLLSFSKRSTKGAMKPFQKLVLSLAVGAICIAIVIFLFFKDVEDSVRESHFASFESSSKLGVYEQAAVSTDARECAAIGRKLLVAGGSAMDGTIGTLLCMGLVIPESTGLGGGSFITYYDAGSKTATVINGREVAPSYATEDMFHGNASLTATGPLAIGVPGELQGYWKSHQRFGKLPWSELFVDTIRLAKTGFRVGFHLASAIQQKAELIKGTEAERLIINPATGKLFKEGELMKRPDLAETLRILSNSTDREFYEGSLTEKMLKDLKAQGSLLTKEDFANYSARIEEPIKLQLPHNLTFYSVRPPGSGSLMGFMLNVILRDSVTMYTNIEDGSYLNQAGLFYHRLVETWKFAYAKRQHMGDEHFDNVTDIVETLMSEDFVHRIRSLIQNDKTFEQEYYEDGAAPVHMKTDTGTAHVSVIDKFGNAASVGTTVNGYFGSKVFSPSTGVLFNNQMDDFSVPGVTNQYNVPPSATNRIEPGKRPLSSMCPAIIVDATGKVRMVIGGSGGTQITTAGSLVALQSLLLGQDIKKSVDAPRIHHQLYPNHITYEADFPQDVLKGLERKGHRTEALSGRGAIIMAAERKNGKIYANSDFRKGGEVDGF